MLARCYLVLLWAVSVPPPEDVDPSLSLFHPPPQHIHPIQLSPSSVVITNCANGGAHHRDRRGVYSELALSRVPAPVTCAGRETEAGRGAGKAAGVLTLELLCAEAEDELTRSVLCDSLGSIFGFLWWVLN